MSAEGSSDLFDLTGRVAIITGGSRGIGLSMAHGFAQRGAKVVVASRKAEACEAAAAELRANGAEALAVPAHMGQMEDLDRLVDATVDRFGGVDILVNNAANPLGLPMDAITPEAWEKSFSVNLRGPFFLFQRCLPHLLASRHAAVVNVISVGAYIAAGNTSMYSAAKAGMLSFTRSMAGQYGTQGIRVNALAPGTVDTKMTRDTGPEAMARMADLSFVGRLGHPDELVGAALLLVSDAGSYITGQCIIVDGGFVPPR